MGVPPFFTCTAGLSHIDLNPPRNGEVPVGRRGRVRLGSILTGKTPATTGPSVSLRLPPPRSGEDFHFENLYAIPLPLLGGLAR
jgi:hypothetical protein